MFCCRQEPFLCISSSLVCDGINQCPIGEEYNSDEDPDVCSKYNSKVDSNVSEIE